MIIKKILKHLFILLPMTTFLALFLWYNIESNAVYYFQHSNKTDKAGVPFVLVDYLWWYIDNEWQIDGNYYYQVDGRASISYYPKDEKISRFILTQNGWPPSPSYTLILDEGQPSNLQIYYEIDENYQLIEKIHFPGGNHELNQVDKEFVKEAIDITTKQLLSKIQKPSLNLQAFYDWTLSDHKGAKIWAMAVAISLGFWAMIILIKYFLVDRLKKETYDNQN